MAAETNAIERPSRSDAPTTAIPSTEPPSVPSTAAPRDSDGGDAANRNGHSQRQNRRPSGANKADRGKFEKRKKNFSRKDKK